MYIGCTKMYRLVRLLYTSAERKKPYAEWFYKLSYTLYTISTFCSYIFLSTMPYSWETGRSNYESEVYYETNDYNDSGIDSRRKSCDTSYFALNRSENLQIKNEFCGAL